MRDGLNLAMHTVTITIRAIVFEIDTGEQRASTSDLRRMIRIRPICLR